MHTLGASSYAGVDGIRQDSSYGQLQSRHGGQVCISRAGRPLRQPYSGLQTRVEVAGSSIEP